MKRFVTIIIMAFALLSAFGQSPTDSLNVYFRVGSSKIDPNFSNNAKNIEEIVNIINQRRHDPDCFIEVSAFASPEGLDKANQRLSVNRCNALVSYLRSLTGLPQESFRLSPEGVAWAELRRLVAASPEIPSQKKVLDILDNTPLWIFNSKGKVIGGRKQKLMNLNNGTPYRWMMKNLFPKLRNAVAVRLCSGCPEEVSGPREVYPVTLPDSIPVESTDTLENYPVTLPDSIEIRETDETEYRTGESDKICSHRFALKTNLLYTAILMPDLELEWRINRHWSVGVTGDVAWWSNDSKHKYYRVALVYPEVKYWINPRGAWHGMNVSAFGGTGKYDLGNGNKGYQGEGWFAGAAFGYMWPITKYLSLDAQVGLGFMRTNVKEYIPLDGHFVYQRTKALNYFGPLKLKLALAWRFGNVECKSNNPVK